MKCKCGCCPIREIHKSIGNQTEEPETLLINLPGAEFSNKKLIITAIKPRVSDPETVCEEEFFLEFKKEESEETKELTSLSIPVFINKQKNLLNAWTLPSTPKMNSFSDIHPSKLRDKFEEESKIQKAFDDLFEIEVLALKDQFLRPCFEDSLELSRISFEDSF